MFCTVNLIIYHYTTNVCNYFEVKQERQVMPLAQIMNTFQHEMDKIEFKLL